MIRFRLLHLLLTLSLAVAWFPIGRAAEGQADRGRGRVPAVYVLDGPGKVAIAFGYPGSKGRLCRCDLPEVGSGVTCAVEDSNPLQAALDWAAAHKRREVRLDQAEYTFSKPQASHIGRIGFYVPSGVHLKGVMVGDEPGSVLTPGIEINGPEAALDQQRFEVLLLPSGSKTDRSVPLNDTTIEALFLNNRLLGGVCMWAGGGTRFRLLHVHSMGSRQSSLIIGNYDNHREDPEVKFRAAIYYARDFDVGWNHVHGANGDGICIIGHDGTIHDNLCENGTTTFDNGITPFIGSTNIRFTHNRIVNFPTAIGLDGSFLPCESLAGSKSPAESEAQCKRMLWEKYRGWEGYHRRHEIADNEILNCRRGIVTYRADDISIHDNRLVGRGIGEAISLEETSNCRVWGNRATGWGIACRLYADRDSALLANGQRVGTSFNRIGVDPQGKSGGNDFRGNSHGIVLQHSAPEAHLRRNVFRANDCRDSSVPALFTGGDEAQDRQFASQNQPDDINFPHHNDRVQER